MGILNIPDINIEDLKKDAREYIEMEVSGFFKKGTDITEVKYVASYSTLGLKDVVFLVKTTDPDHKEFWVVGGMSPLNFYTRTRFISAWDAYGYHAFFYLITCHKDTEFKIIEELPTEDTYHAFISFAGEDRKKIVKPLVKRLEGYGFKIWYADHELKIGDNLRRSIDQGLLKSKNGIIVLSPEFLSKGWPQYELDGLVNLEIEGKAKILPIWHQLTKDDVMKYSPSLAMKKALRTADYSMNEIADSIVSVFWENPVY